MKKIISFFLASLMLISSIAITVSATDNGAGYYSTLVSSAVAIDGVASTGEVWASVEEANVLKLIGNKKADDKARTVTTIGYTESNAAILPSLKVANDGDYVYIFLETPYFGNSRPYGNTVQIQIGWSETETYKSGLIWTDKERAYGSYYINLNENAGGTAHPNCGGAMEGRIAIPDSIKSELAKKDVDIKLSVFLNNAMNVDMTADGTSYQGFTTKGDFVTGDYTKGDTVTLKQAIPEIESSEVIMAGVQAKEAYKETVEGVEKTYTDVRFVAALSDTDFLAGTAEACQYAEVGFEFKSNGKTVQINCWNLYKSLFAADETITPDDFGGDFFFCYTIEKLEAGRTYEFTVSCWTKKADADKVDSEYTYDVTVAVDANGVATITSFITA